MYVVVVVSTFNYPTNYFSLCTQTAFEILCCGYRYRTVSPPSSFYFGTCARAEREKEREKKREREKYCHLSEDGGESRERERERERKREEKH